MRTTPGRPADGQRRASRALAGLLVIAVAALLSGACAGASDRDGGDRGTPGEPWGTHAVGAADLVTELAGGDKPVVVCVAPPSMYSRAHIPGAVLHGPASEPAALAQLTAWAQPLSRATRLVIYCGCCPLAYCPNLRPAFKALEGMGFTNLRVLVLPENFGTDWVQRGYPVER